MKTLIYWGSVLGNVGLLGFIVFVLLEEGLRRNAQVGILLLFLLVPALSLALALTTRGGASGNDESWIGLELAARKAKLRRIINESSNTKEG